MEFGMGLRYSIQIYDDADDMGFDLENASTVISFFRDEHFPE